MKNRRRIQYVTIQGTKVITLPAEIYFEAANKVYEFTFISCIYMQLGRKTVHFFPSDVRNESSATGNGILIIIKRHLLTFRC